MMPKYHYRFVVNPETTVRAIAEKIWAKGSFDVESAIELSEQIEQTVQACTARKLGKIEHSSGGWVQYYNEFTRNTKVPRR